MTEGDPVWNSLEVAKLIISALTPLLVVGLGVILTRSARRLEDIQWASRKIVERRLQLYDEMAPLLNDLLCFFQVVGHFRDIDPPEALTKKRLLDRLFFVNEYLMSAEFARTYNDFLDTCFKHYVGVGIDAQLRMSGALQRAERGYAGWDSSWDDLFVDSTEVANPKEIAERYKTLMLCFSGQVGVR